METYIALLRGINVSGKNKIRMEDLRSSFKKMGFYDIKTYLQSGNVTFQYELSPTKNLEVMIENGIKKDFDLEVPVLVLTASEFKERVMGNPYYSNVKIDPGSRYYVFLKDAIPNPNLTSINPFDYPNEEFQINSDIVYLVCLNGYGNAKLNNNRIENRLKVQATTRNEKTVEALLKMTEN